MGFMKPSQKPAAIAQEKADIAANEVKADENKRQDDVLAGRANIDNTFGGTFNDDFYKKYGEAFTGNYLPQLDDQFKDTKQKLSYALAGRGIEDSTAGIKKKAQADKAYNDKRLAIAGESTDAVNKLKTNVNNQQNAAYALNETSADPQAATNRATADVTTLAAAPTYSALGDAFAGLLDGIGAISKGMGSNVNSPIYTNKWKVANTGGGGSSSVTGGKG